MVFTTLFLLIPTNIKAKIGSNPGITTLMVVMFARYCILPLMLCKTNELSTYCRDLKYINEGVWLMLYEMICIFGALSLFYNRQGKVDRASFYLSRRLWNNRRCLLLVSIIILIGLIVTNRDLIGGVSLIIVGYVEDSSEISEKSSIPKMLWTILTSWLYVYLVLLFSQKYNHLYAKKKYVIYSIVITLLFITLTYISQERISRWYTLMCAVAGIYFLCRCYPTRKKMLVSCIIVPVALLMISATLFKNFAEAKLSNSSQDQVMVTNLDAYLAGPCSVNNSISMANTLKTIGIENLFYDLINNMPIVNHYVDTEKSTVYVYNSYLGRIFSFSGRGDQIIPLIGQGYVYFGYLFAPILSIIFIFFLSLLDDKYRSSTGYFTYLLAFTSCWVAVSPVLNLTLNLSWIYIRIIPLYLFFVLLKKV